MLKFLFKVGELTLSHGVPDRIKFKSIDTLYRLEELIDSTLYEFTMETSNPRSNCARQFLLKLWRALILKSEGVALIILR